VILLSGPAIVEFPDAGILLLVEVTLLSGPAIVESLHAGVLLLVDVLPPRVLAVIGTLVASGLPLVEVLPVRVPAVVLPLLPGLLAVIESGAASGLPLLESLRLRLGPPLEAIPACVELSVKAGVGGIVHCAANPLDSLLVGRVKTLVELVELGQTPGVVVLPRQVAEPPQPGQPVPVGPLGPCGSRCSYRNQRRRVLRPQTCPRGPQPPPTGER